MPYWQQCQKRRHTRNERQIVSIRENCDRHAALAFWVSKQFFSSEYPAECPVDDESPEPAASLQEAPEPAASLQANPTKDSSMQPAGMTRMWRWISAASAWRWSHLPQAMWRVGGRGGAWSVIWKSALLE